jgi:lysozyme family protein
VNDADDTGGETYKGIARNFWGGWGGWINIDGAKKRPNFPKSLYSNVILNSLVSDFYKRQFWDKVGGDFIDNQSIADLLVDSAVNEGIKPAVKRAQSIAGMAQTGVVTPELVTKLNSMV